MAFYNQHSHSDAVPVCLSASCCSLVLWGDPLLLSPPAVAAGAGALSSTDAPAEGAIPPGTTGILPVVVEGYFSRSWCRVLHTRTKPRLTFSSSSKVKPDSLNCPSSQRALKTFEIALSTSSIVG